MVRILSLHSTTDTSSCSAATTTVSSSSSIISMLFEAGSSLGQLKEDEEQSSAALVGDAVLLWPARKGACGLLQDGVGLAYVCAAAGHADVQQAEGIRAGLHARALQDGRDGMHVGAETTWRERDHTHVVLPPTAALDDGHAAKEDLVAVGDCGQHDQRCMHAAVSGVDAQQTTAFA